MSRSTHGAPLELVAIDAGLALNQAQPEVNIKGADSLVAIHERPVEVSQYGHIVAELASDSG